MTRRTERVNHTIQREIGTLIVETLRDPRIPTVTSVTSVETSEDMTEAMVSISVLGTPEEQAEALAALESAAGVLRRELRDRIRMRNIPRLRFRLDTKIAEAQDMLALINRVSAQDRRRQPGSYRMK